MEPRKDDHALVDVIDVLLRDGAVVRADVIVSVADVPLIGIKLTAAIAGMETMTRYGLFEEWDVERRNAAVDRRRYGTAERGVDGESEDEAEAEREGEVAVSPPVDTDGSADETDDAEQ